MLSESTAKIISKGKVMARNSILGYYPYTLFPDTTIDRKKKRYGYIND